MSMRQIIDFDIKDHEEGEGRVDRIGVNAVLWKSICVLPDRLDFCACVKDNQSKHKTQFLNYFSS